MPTDIEEQVAAYFAWIEQRSGVELRPPAGGRVLELHPPPRPSRRRWAAGAGLIATAAAVIGVLLIVDRPEEGPSGPVDTPAATASTTPATTAQPSTTTVESTAPSTTAAAPTTTPGTTPPTTPAETGSDVLSIDLPPYAIPIDELTNCDSCPFFAEGPEGTVAGFINGANSFWIDANPPRILPMSEPLGSARILAIGPGELAYLAVQRPADPVGDVVVVALTGADAGRIVARPGITIDLTGDVSYVPTARGLVGVGCCDASGSVRPGPDAPVVVPWISSAGEPVVDDRPVVSIEAVDGAFDVVRSDSAQRWRIPDLSGWMRGMPLTAARLDGGVVIAFYDTDTQEPRLYVFEPSGTVERLDVAGHGFPGLLTRHGTVLAYDNEDSVLRWNLPTYTEPQPAIDRVADWLGGAGPTFASSDEVVNTIVANLSAPDDCERAPTATVIERTDGDPTTVTIDARFGCDDSGAGSLIELTIASDGDDSWSVVAATRRYLCIRGGGPDLCV